MSSSDTAPYHGLIPDEAVESLGEPFDTAWFAQALFGLLRNPISSD